LLLPTDSDTVFGTNVIQPWNNSTSWATDTDVCTWHGISCDANKLVTQIDLFSNRMTGTLPAELTLITTLVYLDLFDNNLYNVGEEGNAWLGNLTNIENLYYQANYFEYDGVPTHINKLKNLKEYDCSYNLYVGPLTEDNFVGLSNLNYLALGGNSYNSTMPNSLLNLPNLGYLYMDDCFLMGNLDDTLMKLPNICEFRRVWNAMQCHRCVVITCPWLTLFFSRPIELVEFWIDINPGVTGTIPTTFDKVPNLNSLSVSDLSLTGTLPSEIGRLTDMLQMWFYGNALTGSIPTEYGLLTGLTLLQLHFNDFTGVVPTGICSIGIGDLTSDCSNGNVACDCCTECF
jgi:Leucine-rich repeat (LRR) protein